MLPGCPGDLTTLGSWGSCFGNDEWDLAYSDDYFGPGSEEDAGPVDEQTYCTGGHPECADCSQNAPYEAQHPDAPNFESEIDDIYCSPDQSCEDGYVWWDLYNEVETGWQGCNPTVTGCYDEITVSQYYEESDTNYYWCSE